MYVRNCGVTIVGGTSRSLMRRSEKRENHKNHPLYNKILHNFHFFYDRYKKITNCGGEAGVMLSVQKNEMRKLQEQYPF